MSAGTLLAAPGDTVAKPARPTIAKLNFSHEAIIRWMLENPEKTQHDCAVHFGYSDAWLSIIKHSDAFRARWKELSDQADELVVNDIPAKMRGIASLALEGLADQVQAAVDNPTPLQRGFLLETSEKLLAKLGYGGGGKVVVNAPNAGEVNVGVVDRADLERARAKLVESRANSARVIDGESERVTPTT